MRQLSFLPPPLLEHGGDIRKGRRKTARPIDPKRPLHVVMRSTRARGGWSLQSSRNKGRVYSLVHDTAERYGLRVHRFANVGNHVHLLVMTPSRRAFQAYLRVVAGGIAFHVTGARKGDARGRFWDQLAYSRVCSWGREFDQLMGYLLENMLEGWRLLDRKREQVKPIPLLGLRGPP